MVLGSTSNMVNVKEADRGNIIFKDMEKKLTRLEELTIEKTGRGKRTLGRGEKNIHERNGSYLKGEEMEFILEPKKSYHGPGI